MAYILLASSVESSHIRVLFTRHSPTSAKMTIWRSTITRLSRHDRGHRTRVPCAVWWRLNWHFVFVVNGYLQTTMAVVVVAAPVTVEAVDSEG